MDFYEFRLYIFRIASEWACCILHSWLSLTKDIFLAPVQIGSESRPGQAGHLRTETERDVALCDINPFTLAYKGQKRRSVVIMQQEVRVYWIAMMIVSCVWQREKKNLDSFLIHLRLEWGFQHLPGVIWLAALVVDKDLELHLVLDPEHLPELLHQLLPVSVAAEGGPSRAECGLSQVSLRQTPGLKQLKLLWNIK